MNLVGVGELVVARLNQKVQRDPPSTFTTRAI